MLSNINPRLKRTLLVLLSIPVLYFSARSCFSSTEGIEKKVEAVEQRIDAKQYRLIVSDAIRGLQQYPEYANTLLEASLDIAGKNNSYCNKVRLKMWNFAVSQLEKNPELSDYLGPNAQQYMKRRAINRAAGKVIENVYDGLKEGAKIIGGE